MAQFQAPLPTLDISMRSSPSDLLFLRRRLRRDTRGLDPAELRHAVDATLNLCTERRTNAADATGDDDDDLEEDGDGDEEGVIEDVDDGVVLLWKSSASIQQNSCSQSPILTTDVELVAPMLQSSQRVKVNCICLIDVTLPLISDKKSSPSAEQICS